MRVLELQKDVIYGPIRSRRFGRSLGINLLPANAKLCTFSCGYCQYSETSGAPAPFPDAEAILEAADEALKKLSEDEVRTDWIMIAGNGEPTLHPNFVEIVEGLMALRDERAPDISVGILSNSSTCGREDVRYGLSLLDGRFMKLDAGNPAVFESVNRPRTRSYWRAVTEGLCRLPQVTIQSLFVTGDVDNTGVLDVEDWIEWLFRIRPMEVQIYTIDRQPQQPNLFPVSADKLQAIAAQLRSRMPVSVDVYL